LQYGNPSALTFFAAGYGFLLLALTSFIPDNAAIATASMWGLLIPGAGLFWAGVWNYARGESFFAIVATFIGMWAFALFFTSKFSNPGGPPDPLALGLIGIGAAVGITIFLVFAIRAKMWVFAATVATLGGVSFWLGMQGMPFEFAHNFRWMTGFNAIVNFALLYYQGFQAVMDMNVGMAVTYEEDKKLVADVDICGMPKDRSSIDS
jgi:hypothetical protein